MGIALLSSREPTASEFELRLHLKLGLHGESARVSYCDRDVNVTMRIMHASVGGCCIWQHEAHPQCQAGGRQWAGTPTDANARSGQTEIGRP